MDTLDEWIVNINAEINDDLNNISKNCDVSKTDLLKKHLREFLDQYPEKHRTEINPRAKEKIKSLKIAGLSKKTYKELVILSANIGINKNALLKLVLYITRESYPPDKKRPVI